ncbi:spiro-SPASM protein [Candidatus Haliotispira prima]|uniref:Spiro-SPASM protein n=1 Tax=Candidatus Haliotispira prima TaxID=3034016 RepID=A0ABY8MFL6_9SPIO|nr:spiro-SPASM protein [Candidatus Haliotispira prima]
MSKNNTEVSETPVSDGLESGIPHVHLAFVNAIHLNPYALEALEAPDVSGGGTGGEDSGPVPASSSWQICLEKLAQLPHCRLPSAQDSNSGLPCICLLPPERTRPDEAVAAALEPEWLKGQGLHPIFLEDYSEMALLRAVREGIELFYPDAFRPDATVKALENYLDCLDRKEEAGGTDLPDTGRKQSARVEVFGEDVGLPLAMRFGDGQLGREQFRLPENLTSRQIHCYWIEGDAPFLSPELTRKLYDRHHDHAAELSLSDIYPQGLVPMLFQAAVLSRLSLLRRDGTDGVNGADGKACKDGGNASYPSIPEIAERDLNLFATELLPADKDYRLLRLELRAGNKRQFQTLRNLYCSLAGTGKAGADGYSLEQILHWLEVSPQSSRSLPRYFPIQISAFCPQRCSYCPYPKIMGPEFFPPGAGVLQRELQKGKEAVNAPKNNAPKNSAAFMPRQLWSDLLGAIVRFAGDGVINLSPLGEPLLHPEFVCMVEDLLRQPSLQLVIETGGASWQAEDIRRLLALDQKEGRITWIVSLDALDPELYRELRAPDEDISPLTGMCASQQKAHALVELLLHSPESRPGQVYVQAVRMKENEADLEAFYRYWAEGRKPDKSRVPEFSAVSGISDIAAAPAVPVRPQVIVQKYNTYAGLLPDRQLLRLDPIERLPCRRLAREMVFGLDGQCYLCVQDLQQELARRLEPGQRLGCFPQQNLEDLWVCGQSLYEQHIAGHYPGICRNCDEYYVHNF